MLGTIISSRHQILSKYNNLLYSYYYFNYHTLLASFNGAIMRRCYEKKWSIHSWLRKNLAFSNEFLYNNSISDVCINFIDVVWIWSSDRIRHPWFMKKQMYITVISDNPMWHVATSRWVINHYFLRHCPPTQHWQHNHHRKQTTSREEHTKQKFLLHRISFLLCIFFHCCAVCCWCCHWCCCLIFIKKFVVLVISSFLIVSQVVLCYIGCRV